MLRHSKDSYREQYVPRKRWARLGANPLVRVFDNARAEDKDPESGEECPQKDPEDGTDESRTEKTKGS